MKLTKLFSKLFKGNYKGTAATGRSGEKLAERYLKSNGYIILERGWRYRRMELDIIAKKGKVIAIIEVKTRSSHKFAKPHESVSHQQKRRIVTAGEIYQKSSKLNDYLIRYDIVSVLIENKEQPVISHIEAAF